MSVLFCFVLKNPNRMMKLTRAREIKFARLMKLHLEIELTNVITGRRPFWAADFKLSNELW